MKIPSRAMLAAALLFSVSCTSLRDAARAEARAIIAAPSATDAVITDSSIAALPPPVRRYLRFSGAVGKRPVAGFRARFSGVFKTQRDAAWLPVNVEQYDRINDPARIFYIAGARKNWLTVEGRDRYVNGQAVMRIRLFSFFDPVDMKKKALDTSGLAAFLNDLVLCPTALAGPKVRWMPVDSLSARATISDRGMTVSGVFHFNDKGEIVDFVSHNRYATVGDRVLHDSWNTPFSEYRLMDGFMVPAHGEAYHDYDGKKFCYAKFELQDIEYNAAGPY
jgi:hypothetical protein